MSVEVLLLLFCVCLFCWRFLVTENMPTHIH